MVTRKSVIQFTRSWLTRTLSAGEPTCPNCWKVAGHPGPCGSDD